MISNHLNFFYLLLLGNSRHSVIALVGACGKKIGPQSVPRFWTCSLGERLVFLRNLTYCKFSANGLRGKGETYVTAEPSYAEIIFNWIGFNSHNVYSVFSASHRLSVCPLTQRMSKKRLEDLENSATLDGHRKSLCQDRTAFREYFGYRMQ